MSCFETFYLLFAIHEWGEENCYSDKIFWGQFSRFHGIAWASRRSRLAFVLLYSLCIGWDLGFVRKFGHQKWKEFWKFLNYEKSYESIESAVKNFSLRRCGVAFEKSLSVDVIFERSVDKSTMPSMFTHIALRLMVRSNITSTNI